MGKIVLEEHMLLDREDHRSPARRLARRIT
jgi:hypothetical protein